MFPEALFFLNNGTRQSDSSSCITDAICILKEALQLPEIIDLICQRCYENHEAYVPRKNSRFFQQAKPGNFYVFRMPEKLLLTAQRSDYLTEAEADLNVRLRDGKTLGEHRERCKLQVTLFGQETKPASINSYLFKKTIEHRYLLDKIQQKSTLDDEYDGRRTSMSM